MKKKILVTMLAIVMVMLFIPAMVMTASAADGVSYIDENGALQTQDGVTEITDQTSLSDGWYVVNGNVTIDSRINVGGDVHLILADGATLTANEGIEVAGSLTIYGQAGGTGNLIANGTATNATGINININGTLTVSGTANVTAEGDSGRGIYNSGTFTVSGTAKITAKGNEHGIANSGTFTVTGGTLTVTGTSFGIYNQSDSTLKSTLKFTGGSVEATANGENGYGIYNDGTFTVSDTAEVTAKGNEYGIRNQSTLEITGGMVTATATGEEGRGISNSDTLTISGGTVTATAEDASGRGIHNNGTLTISGGTLTATAEGDSGDGISNNGTIQTGESMMLVIKDENGNSLTLDDLANHAKVTVSAVKPFIITGGTLGTDYTYENGVLTFKASGDYTVSMADVITETDHIIVVEGTNVNLTLNGVVIKTTKNNAFTVNSGASVTLSTTDKGATLQGAGYGIYNNGGTLTVEDGTLTVTATGFAGTGISNTGDGEIFVSGGTVKASAEGEGSCGIFNNGVTLTVSDGTVNVTTTSGSSYGISNGGTLTISGGILTATAEGDHSYGIDNYGTLDIKGGTVDVTVMGEYGNGINNSGTLTILGGTINATATSVGSSGISNYSGTIQTEENMTIVIKDENGNSLTLDDLANHAKVTVSAVVPFKIEGGTLDTDYEYENGVLTFINGGTYTVSMVDGVTATAHVIVVEGTDIDVNLILDGVVIKTTKNDAFTVNSGASVTLSTTDQGATLQGAGIGIYNYGGTLTISGGTLTATAEGDSGDGISNNGGTLTIEGENTNVTAKGGTYGIYNSGTLNISDGTVEATATNAGGRGISNNGGTLTVSGTANVTAKGGSRGIYNYGKLTVEDGTVNVTATGVDGSGIYNDFGTLTVSGTANVTAKGGAFGIYNSTDGTLNISDGKVEATATGEEGYGIYNNGELTVKGGTLTATAEGEAGYGIDNYGTLEIIGGTAKATATGEAGYGIDNYGTLTIEGENTNVTAKGGAYDIYNRTDGTLTISGGTLTATAEGDSGDGIYNNGTLEITGGTVEATATGEEGCGIYNSTDGTLTISGGTLTATAEGDSGDGISNDGTLTISGGTLTATAEGEYGEGIYNSGTIQTGESMMLVIKDENGNSLTLNDLANHAKVTVSAAVPFKIEGGTLGTDYTYKNGVLTFLNGGTYTVSMADGVTATDHVIVINDNVTGINLILDGVVIKTTKTTAFEVLSGASVTLSTTDQGATLQGATLQGAMFGISNNGTLTVLGGTVNATATGKGGAGILNNNEMTVNGGTLTATMDVDLSYAICNYGTMNVEGGTVEATATGANTFGIDNLGTLSISGTANVTAKGDNIGIFNAGGTLNINGGTVTADGGVGINNDADGTLNVNGGTVEGDIYWLTGELDLSAHPNPAGITIYNDTGEPKELILQNGFSFYDENGNKVDGALAADCTYTVDKTQYQLSLNSDNGINEENSSFSHGNEMLAWGTPVSFTLALHDRYELVSVTLNGKALEPDAESGAYSFEMPMSDAEIVITTKCISFAWGTSADTMTSMGDFFDLVAAINAGEAPYARMLDDYEVYLSEDDVTVSGESFIDLNGYLLEFNSPTNNRVILGEGADITFFVDQKIDDISAYCNIDEDFELELQAGSKLTVSGAFLAGSIFYNGGTLDISGAHLHTAFVLYNLTDAEITISDVVIFDTPFRAFDPAWYDDPSYKGYTVSTVTTLAANVEETASACIEAVFTVTFDFGEGSGTMPTLEVSSAQPGRDIPTPEGLSHPEGLSLIGWTYEGKKYDYTLANSICMLEFADITLTAKWGAPLYVGGVAMNDGEYLASGATQTTTKRPAAGGYAYYKDGVLTLNNYQFSGEGFAYEYDGYNDAKYFALIYSATDLVIELVGSSNLLGVENYQSTYYADIDGVVVGGDLTVRGNGSLRVQVDEDAFYIDNLTIESGTVTLAAGDEAIESDSITLLDGVLITLSDDGIYNSGSVHVKGGEFYVLPNSEYHDDVALRTETLTVEGGLLVVKGSHGIRSDHITISGGEVAVESNHYGISPYSPPYVEDAFVNITGGKVTLIAGYCGIYFNGAVTVSGGELNIEASEHGIYAGGDVTISGGELSIEAYNGIYAYGDVTISGGELSIEAYNGIYAYGNVTISSGALNIVAYSSGIYTKGDVTILGGVVTALNYETAICANDVTISGGRVFLNAGGKIGIEAETLTVSGTKTALLVQGTVEVTGETAVNAEEVIARISSTDSEVEDTLYEGVEIKHTWSETYSFNNSEHWHICTDKDCTVMHFAKAFVQSMGGAVPAVAAEMMALELYAGFFETETGIGEHTIPEGETACTVCGYGAEEPGEEIPEDVVLMVGDNYLKSGAYLTLNGDVVTEKPEGGYLYVEIDTTGEMPIGNIVLHNFTFEHTGQVLLVPTSGEMMWTMYLEGENVLTVHPAAQGQSLGEFELNGIGIVSNGVLLVVGNGALTVNAEIGVLVLDGVFGIGEGATVTINAEIGVAAFGGLIGVGEGATVTVNANTLGILTNQTLLVEDATLNVHVTAGTGIQGMGSVYFRENSSVTVTAGEDGISIMGGEISIENNQQLTITAQGNGIFLEEAEFNTENATVTVTAEGNAIEAIDRDTQNGRLCIDFTGSTIDLSAGEAGVYLISTNLEVYGGTLNIQSKYNEINEGFVEVTDSAILNVFATDTAFELEYGNLDIANGSKVIIVSRDKGIYSEGESHVTVNDATLFIEAARYGIYGFFFGVGGDRDMVDISVRALEAIHCENIYLEYDYAMNAAPYDYAFWDENGEIASYVTIRGYALVEQEMAAAIEALNQLLSEGGEFENIANSIADVNVLLDTLTNAEGEGRIDLIEAANEAINAALAKLTADLEQAQKDLNDAITSGDAALDTKISNLNDALAKAEAAYAAADKALGEKLTAAEATLNAAITAVDKKLDEAKTALEAAIKTNSDNLTAEVAKLNKAIDDAEAAYAAADKELGEKLTAAEATLNAAIKAVDDKLAAAKAELEAAIKANSDNLTAEVAKLNKAIDDAEAAYAAADKTITDELTAAKNTLTTVQTRLETAEKTITELQTAVEALKTLINQDGEVDLTEITAQVNTINAKMEALDGLGLSAFKASVTETLATLNESVSTLNSTVAGIDKEQIATNKQAVEDLEASLAEMQTELEALDTLAAKDAELEGEIDAISGNITTITGRLNGVDEKLGTLEEKLTELEKIATGDTGTIEKIQQALVDVNKALEDLQGIEDQTRLVALEDAAERVDATLKTIGDKLDTIDPADITANKSAVEALGTSLAALQETVTALGTTDGTITESVEAMNTSLETLSGKVTAAEARFVAAESAINALQSAVTALQQANQANANLKAELDALKAEIILVENEQEDEQKAIAIISIIGLGINVVLIVFVVVLEIQKKIVTSAIRSGFKKAVSKFRKSSSAPQSNDTKGEE